MNKHIHSFLIILLFAFFSMPAAQAQIKLNSNGVVGIGTSPSSTNRLLVSDALGGSTRTAVRGAQIGSANTNIGVRGIASSGYSNYGVYGSASGGYNRWAGYFSGNVYTTGSYLPSDERFKKNITAVNAGDMLSKIVQLKPVQYQFLSEDELQENRLPSLYAKEGNHIGLMAKHVEEIFPEFVIDVVHPLDDERAEMNGKAEAVVTKAINYQELTVALLAAVQELQGRVEELEKTLRDN